VHDRKHDIPIILILHGIIVERIPEEETTVPICMNLEYPSDEIEYNCSMELNDSTARIEIDAETYARTMKID
jgi:hypothetical protein